MAKKQKESYFIYLKRALDKYDGDSLFLQEINAAIINLLNFQYNNPLDNISNLIQDNKKIKSYFINPFFKILFYALIYPTNRDLYPHIKPLKRFTTSLYCYSEHPLYHFASALLYDHALDHHFDSDLADEHYDEGARKGCPFCLYTITSLVIAFQKFGKTTRPKKPDNFILGNLNDIERAGLAAGPLRYATYLMDFFDYQKYGLTIRKKLFSASLLSATSPLPIYTTAALKFIEENFDNEEISEEEMIPYLDLAVLEPNKEGYYMNYLYSEKFIKDPYKLYAHTVEPLILAAHYGEAAADIKLSHFYLYLEQIKSESRGLFHLERAMAKGSPSAYFERAAYEMNSKETKINYDFVFLMLKSAAELELAEHKEEPGTYLRPSFGLKYPCTKIDDFYAFHLYFLAYFVLRDKKINKIKPLVKELQRMHMHEFVYILMGDYYENLFIDEDERSAITDAIYNYNEAAKLKIPHALIKRGIYIILGLVSGSEEEAEALFDEATTLMGGDKVVELQTIYQDLSLYLKEGTYGVKDHQKSDYYYDKYLTLKGS